MWIFHAAGQDMVVLNSIEGHGKLADAAGNFLQHGKGSIFFPAGIGNSPEPYERFLRGINLVSASGGVMVSIGADDIVEITGAPENLIVYFSCFRFTPDEEGCHHHPEYQRDDAHMAPGSLGVIIEADSEYTGELLDKAQLRNDTASMLTM